MVEEDVLETHQGGCHCGLIRFEVDAPSTVVVDECNCSICRAVGFVHLIVPADRFRLLEGSEQLTEYRFGTETAKHLFCKRCGVKSFYVPRSHPDGISVNFRCLDQDRFLDAEVKPFDGANWEQNVAELRDRDANGGAESQD